jgi:hypothetical protein
MRSASDLIGRWVCPRNEDGSLFEDYAYLVTDVANGSYLGQVFYVRRWPGSNSATVVERIANLREWRGISSHREVMPDGWLPNWWGTLPEGPSMVAARKGGRIAGRIP